MCKCLTPIAPNIFVARPRSSVENLANSLLQGELRLRKRRCPGVLAAIFALILDTMDVIQITQTCSEVP